MLVFFLPTFDNAYTISNHLSVAQKDYLRNLLENKTELRVSKDGRAMLKGHEGALLAQYIDDNELSSLLGKDWLKYIVNRYGLQKNDSFYVGQDVPNYILAVLEDNRGTYNGVCRGFNFQCKGHVPYIKEGFSIWFSALKD